MLLGIYHLKIILSRDISYYILIFASRKLIIMQLLVAIYKANLQQIKNGAAEATPPCLFLKSYFRLLTITGNSFQIQLCLPKLEAYIQASPQNFVLGIGFAAFHIPVFYVGNHVLGYSVFSNCIPAFCTFF